jgi:hypothetical protein
LLTPEPLIATGERDVGIARERVHHRGQEFRLPPIIVLEDGRERLGDSPEGIIEIACSSPVLSW